MAQTPAVRLRLAVARIAELTRGRPPSCVPQDDDDGVVGSIVGDDAVGFDPVPVLRSLGEQGAPAIVIGQVAAILHGSKELTGDLDLLWSGEPGDVMRMVAAFAALQAMLFDENRVLMDEAAAAFSLPKVLFRTPSASGDCCTPRLPWGGDVHAFLERAESTEIEGAVVRYLGLDDLIAMRRMAGRPKDLRRLPELYRLVAETRRSRASEPGAGSFR